MLPRESTIKQLKKLRSETKGTDIGDLTVNDRFNKNLPNIQYIGNPIDNKIQSWEDFSKNDSQLQTIAFKSKTVNKSLIKKNTKKMKKELNKINKIKEFFTYDDEKQDIIETIKEISIDYSDQELSTLSLEELQLLLDELEKEKEYNSIISKYDEDIFNDKIKTFEKFSVNVKTKELETPEYTMLGKEKELKSNPLFGVGQVNSSTIKKISDFNTIDYSTPRERQILNAGQYINNGKVKGIINRIEGSEVYIELSDEPMTIKKFKIKDIIKTKKEE